MRVADECRAHRACLHPSGGREPKAKAVGADGLDLSAAETLDAGFARKVKAAGLKLYVWTVNEADVAKRMVGIGVDGITTDRPGWLREQLAR